MKTRFNSLKKKIKEQIFEEEEIFEPIESKSLKHVNSTFEWLLLITLGISLIVYLAISLNPNYPIVKIDFISISISLAGFVLISAFFDKSTRLTRRALFETSKWFIYSSISFISFYLFFPLLNFIMKDSLSYYFLTSVTIIAWFLAVVFFSGGIMKLLRVIHFGKFNLTKTTRRNS